MKRKIINAVISKKFDQWRESITDVKVREVVKNNTICTGGCIASMLLGEPINDFDFYFRNHTVALAVAEYYVEKFKNAKPQERQHITVKSTEDRVYIFIKSAGAASESDDDTYAAAQNLSSKEQQQIASLMEEGEGEEQEKEKEDKKGKFRPVFLSRNAISLSNDVQLVIRFFGSPDQIHETYDFVHCQNYWDSYTREVTLRPEALEALLTKELRYNGSKYPLCSLFRLKKFVERGWRVNCGTILKIAWNLREYDLSSIPVLEEQLTGVDVAWFMQVIQALQERNKEKGDISSERVDGSYLMQLIEKLF